MPRFTVVWADDVQDDFINAWLVSDTAGRQHLSDAANAIDANGQFIRKRVENRFPPSLPYGSGDCPNSSQRSASRLKS